MSKFIKVKPADMKIDHKFQRELDEGRCKNMAKSIDPERIGVPVLSRRSDGSLAVIDGQHRVTALKQAGKDGEYILCEVHEGLTVTEEAALFLKLNGGRKAVSVFDKWRARIVANDRLAHDITTVLESVGLRISRNPSKNTVCAIQVVESVYARNGNLRETLNVLKRWGDGTAPSVFDGELIKYMSSFLLEHPDLVLDTLLDKLETVHPERLLRRIKREQGADTSVHKVVVANAVLRDIYNHRNKKKLSPPSAARSAIAAQTSMVQ
jgi:hypothetical protein